jgi:uncharacterized protein
MKGLTAFGSGLVFAVGLCLAGMTLPTKVIAFLDITGSWDPSLAFVMLGAIAVHAPFARGARRMGRPRFESCFSLPVDRDVDGALVAGAAIFGVGWGLSGYCPGPAVVSLAVFGRPTVVFVAAMVSGILLFQLGSARYRRIRSSLCVLRATTKKATTAATK